MIGASLSVDRLSGGGTVVTCSLVNPAPAAASGQAPGSGASPNTAKGAPAYV
jgi:hypothetical protein